MSSDQLVPFSFNNVLYSYLVLHAKKSSEGNDVLNFHVCWSCFVQDKKAVKAYGKDSCKNTLTCPECGLFICVSCFDQELCCHLPRRGAIVPVDEQDPSFVLCRKKQIIDMVANHDSPCKVFGEGFFICYSCIGCLKKNEGMFWSFLVDIDDVEAREEMCSRCGDTFCSDCAEENLSNYVCKNCV